MSRIAFTQALARLDIMTKLATFDPHIAGTPPLGLDLPGSDIDVLCHAPDLDAFARIVENAFAREANFKIRRASLDAPSLIANFEAFAWPFEVFAQTRPVDEQTGWRHFEAERRLLSLGGARLRAAVMAARREGLKTEPAFARVLGLTGDPYAALLTIADEDDAALAARAAAAVRR
ncbi:MAG: DUF4269 domain-containing protein [Tagaea sp. CACIAM 22H2]|nr:DUF4269 domain-containing protein [Tagaea sp. CACIAM 22H2]